MLSKTLGKVGIILVIAGLIITSCDQPTNIPKDGQAEPELETSSQSGDPLEGQYIVVFKQQDVKGKSKADKVKAVSKLRSSLLTDYSIAREAISSEYNLALQGFAGKLSKAQVQALRNDSRVDYIEEDKVITLAPPCGTPNGGECDDGGGGGSDQVTPWGITRVGGAVDGSSLNDAWVIDTGIDLDHPDLNVDVNRSAVFVTQGSGSGSPDDGNGHGTHVAGTIAAINNNIDVVGVAAGATVVAVKVLDNRGSGQYSWVINGIDYVAANASRGDVANLSLGGGVSDAVDDAVRNAAGQGIYFSIAAGNDGDDANNYSPARVEYNNVWTVSATDESDTFASFSNWSGPTDPPIEYAAPGVSVLSLYSNGGTRTLNGTSMATPHVAGVLLVTGGNPSSDGFANGDPDGDPDPIVHH